MNNFDAKWQVCAARARATPGREEAAPFGFAARVLAAAMQSPASSVSLEVVWQRLMWRSLGVVGAILVICVAIEAPHFRDRRPLDPGVENTVAQLVWSL